MPMLNFDNVSIYSNILYFIYIALSKYELIVNLRSSGVRLG